MPLPPLSCGKTAQEDKCAMAGRLTDDEVNAYLDSRPGWIMLTTIGRDRYPHTVPIGYFRLGDEIYMGCRAGTQKLKNIARNPRVSLLLESGATMRDIRGVMIQGEADVLTSPDDVLRLSREAARLRGTPDAELPTAPRPNAAYIRVRRHRVISWDYGRGS
jgi:nitroimidazol reductase NimA-like FMN-containing flavoprotein (pyridoxamine 5'-phosphate oxidase superfamily)